MDIELKNFFKKLLFSSSLLITYHASRITFRDRSSPTEIKRGNHGGGGDPVNGDPVKFFHFPGTVRQKERRQRWIRSCHPISAVASKERVS